MKTDLDQQIKSAVKGDDDRFKRLFAGRQRELPVRASQAKLKRLITSLPGMLGDLEKWTAAMPPTEPVARMREFALAYLRTPTDFVNDGRMGLAGLLDDAYLVANVYEKTVNLAEAGGATLSPKPSFDIDELREASDLARKVMPAEMVSIDQILDHVGRRTGFGFGPELSRAAKGGPTTQRLQRRTGRPTRKRAGARKS